MPEVYLFTCCTGSAGNIGGHAVRAFHSALPEDSTVVLRLGVRSPAKARALFADILEQPTSTIEIVQLDLTKPETYSDALKDTTAVFLGQPDSGGIDSKEMYNEFIEAAASSSSKPPLIVSFVAGAIGELDMRTLLKKTGCVLFDPHFLAHEVLAEGREKGRIRVSFVDASTWFFQNYVWLFADLIKANYLAVPNNNAVLPYIDSRDVGDFVACVMKDHEKYANRDFVLTGAVKLSVSEWASKLSECLGRKVLHSTDGEPLEGALTDVPVGPGITMWDIMKPFFETEGRVSEVDAPLHPAVFEEVTGRKHRGVDNFVREIAATGAWNPDVAGSEEN